MTTAAAIEEITDAGQFEILAVRVLRLVDEDCRRIEHLGVNAEGKTIPGALDAFVLVPGSSPPRFVIAAFTTWKQKDLKDKWLFDHTESEGPRKGADDGDLIKAAQKADAIRKDHPDAEFIVHLCTNKRLDSDLMSTVYAKATALHLCVEFLAQSQIRDCLDMTPDGQWLRKEHLGISAERVSEGLLRELSAESVRRYAQEFLITQPDRFIRTTAGERLSASVGTRGRTLHVVLGASGVGKSVVSYQALSDHIQAGGIGFWIPGEVAAHSSSLEEAIDQVLRALHSAAEPGAGAAALRLATAQKKLLLITDDVNRSSDPRNVLRRIASWARPAVADGKSAVALVTFAIVVPAWEVFWRGLHEFLKEQPWLGVIPVALMSVDEAVRCLRVGLGAAHQLGVAELERAAQALGNDPILIGLFVELRKQNPAQSAEALAPDVLVRFIQLKLDEAASTVQLLPKECKSALVALAEAMLRQREFYPAWADVPRWLSESNTDAVRTLVKQGAICRTSDRGGEARLEFRHDRILEHFLVLALTPYLARPEEQVDVLCDPFYINFVGRSFVVMGASGATMEWLRKHNPLALLAAIRFFPADSRTAPTVACTAGDWLLAAVRSRATPPAILYDAYHTLEQTDSPLVLEITKSLRTHRLLALARLANGDAAGGILFFNHPGHFYPSWNAPFVDRVLERALRQHCESLVSGVTQILHNSSATIEDRIGALTLAGFIGDEQFVEAVSFAWNIELNKEEILVPALWAGMRCGSGDPAAVLDPMIAFWATLSDEGKNGRSERSTVSQILRFAIRRSISEPVIRYLVEVGASNEALWSAITYILEQSDHPLAVKFVVTRAAEIVRRTKETGGFSPWISMLGDQWDPVGSRGRRLPDPSRREIAKLWQDEGSPPWLRSTAMRLWVKATDDLEELGSVMEDAPDFETPLWRRAELGDIGAVPHVKKRLSTDEYWFHVVPPIWCSEFVAPTDAALNALASGASGKNANDSNEAYMLADLLRDIPKAEAEALLTKHWNGLCHSARFIQVALYLGTPSARALADVAVRSCPPTVDPFQFIEMFFGFNTFGLSDRLTLEHVDTLLPYIQRVTDLALEDIVVFCSHRGRRDWAERNVRLEFDRRRRIAAARGVQKEDDFIIRVGKHEFPSDQDLFDDLDEMEQAPDRIGPAFWWTEGFAERGDPPDRWRRVLNEWVSRQPSVVRLRIAGGIISELGRRSDLDLLTKYDVQGARDELDRLVANVSFRVKRRSLA